MEITYFHVAADVPPLSKVTDTPQAAVVIDVLRATTTIACALHNGSDGVQTFADLGALHSAATNWPVNSRLLIGERDGCQIEGFDIGNSPVDVTPERVQGRRLFMSTTNGTRALQQVRSVDHLHTAALLNRRAVANRLLKDGHQSVWIVGSGWEGSYALEDSLAAGALAAAILETDPLTTIANDELTAALALWEQWRHAPEECLRIASHGQRLAGLGNHDGDFHCCAQVDVLSVVPTQDSLGVLRNG